MQEHNSRQFYDSVLCRVSSGSQRNKNRLRLILAHKQGGKLLEIGCGQGALLEKAREHFEIEGIDLSLHAIESIREAFGDRVRTANIEQEALSANAYDAVAVFNVLEHLRNPGEVIRRVHEALKADGVIVGSVPNNAGLVGRAVTALTNFFDKTHCSTYSPKRWEALFRDAGFREIDIFGEVLLGPSRNAYVRNRFWKHLSFNMVFTCRK